MSRVEIARFGDVYEAELAAAFLRSRGLEVEVTERFATTMDPLLQRALGIRLMALAHQAEAARALLDQARAGAFAEPDDDADERAETRPARGNAVIVVLSGLLFGGFPGTGPLRRVRPIQMVGLALLIVVVGLSAVIWIASRTAG